MKIRSEVLDWFEEAKSDLDYAKKSFKMRSYNWACFIARQAAEKALKSFMLAFLRRKPLHSHDLTKLYGVVKDRLKLPVEVVESLGELSSYYTLARYPNAGLTRPSLGISKNQAERAISLAEKILRRVDAEIKRAIKG